MPAPPGVEPVSYLTKQAGYNQDVSPLVPADIGLTFQTVRFNDSLPAGYSAVVNRQYKINSGVRLAVGSGARLRIL